MSVEEIKESVVETSSEEPEKEVDVEETAKKKQKLIKKNLWNVRGEKKGKYMKKWKI